MSANVILICGAGPVGLTAANSLARHGIPVRIIDTAEGPTRLSKALVVWRRTLQVLDSGLPATAFLPHGHQLKNVSIWADGKQLGAIEIDDDPFDLPTGLLIPQSETERVLIEAASTRGVEIEWQTRLVDFTVGEESVTCTLETPNGEEEITCSRPRGLRWCTFGRAAYVESCVSRRGGGSPLAVGRYRNRSRNRSTRDAGRSFCSRCRRIIPDR